MRPPYLTVPIQTSNLGKIEDLLRKKLPEVGAIEIWVDQLRKIDRVPERLEALVQRWRGLTDKKLVIVCKDPQEKGKFTGTAKEKLALLLAAGRGGADYVDIGLHSGKAAVRQLVALSPRKTKVIVSHHDFEKTPPQRRLETILRQMTALGASVVKLATMVHGPEDTERLMQLAFDLKSSRQKHIILGMGQLGLMTRVFSKPLGNELNFVTLDQKTAPGQISLDQMITFYHVFGY